MAFLSGSKARAAALLAAVFLAGGVLSWAVQAWADEQGRERRSRRRSTDAMVEYLNRELSLTEAQRESVHAVFVRHRAGMESAWREVAPRMDSLRQSMRAQISSQLDSVQRERYARLLAEHDRRHRRADSGKDTTGGRK